jgi:hypothetical protein
MSALEQVIPRTRDTFDRDSPKGIGGASTRVWAEGGLTEFAFVRTTEQPKKTNQFIQALFSILISVGTIHPIPDLSSFAGID